MTNGLALPVKIPSYVHILFSVIFNKLASQTVVGKDAQLAFHLSNNFFGYYFLDDGYPLPNHHAQSSKNKAKSCLKIKHGGIFCGYFNSNHN